MPSHRSGHVCLLFLLVNAVAASVVEVSSACEGAEGSTPSRHCSADEKQAAALLQVKSSVSAFKHRDHTAAATNHTARVLNNASRHREGVSKQRNPVEPLIWQMIRSDPWNCALLPPGDPRHTTCTLGPDAEGLNPALLSCGLDPPCGVEQANAYRTLHLIGVLPCCRTPPFCGAPVCAQQLPSTTPNTCTKRAPLENVGYMKLQETWPAYHAYGGAFELDTLKYMDLLACKGQPSCPETAFDLMFDLGANTGYFTEKVSVRNFAKNYIMIEANPAMTQVLRARWGDASWRQAWYTQQAGHTETEQVPDVEIINQALSNHSGGILDLCQTEGAMGATGCNVQIAHIDSIVPASLTPAFQEHLANAQSAFIKVDTEGMDELVMRGMMNLLDQKRGQYENGSPRYLVNFMQFEYAPSLMKAAKDRENFQEYDLKTTTKFLESIGFETFLIGPRFLPISHGSWDDAFKTFTEDPRNNAGSLLNYPNFGKQIFPWCNEVDCAKMDKPSFTTDVFAMRSSHPSTLQMKVALGACQESKDFDITDPQYVAR